MRLFIVGLGRDKFLQPVIIGESHQPMNRKIRRGRTLGKEGQRYIRARAPLGPHHMVAGSRAGSE